MLVHHHIHINICIYHVMLAHVQVILWKHVIIVYYYIIMIIINSGILWQNILIFPFFPVGFRKHMVPLLSIYVIYSIYKYNMSILSSDLDTWKEYPSQFISFGPDDCDASSQNIFITLVKDMIWNVGVFFLRYISGNQRVEKTTIIIIKSRKDKRNENTKQRRYIYSCFLIFLIHSIIWLAFQKEEKKKKTSDSNNDNHSIISSRSNRHMEWYRESERGRRVWKAYDLIVCVSNIPEREYNGEETTNRWLTLLMLIAKRQLYSYIGGTSTTTTAQYWAATKISVENTLKMPIENLFFFPFIWR